MHMPGASHTHAHTETHARIILFILQDWQVSAQENVQFDERLNYVAQTIRG